MEREQRSQRLWRRVMTAPNSTTGTRQPGAGIAACRALVIDDDPLAVELFSEALRALHLEVHTASGATEGLSLAQKIHPQIVLSDMVMPGMTGMELLERMVANDPGVNVFVITGHYSTESAVEAIQKGACDYLTKPISIEKLQERIGKWLADAKVRYVTSKLDAALLKTCQLHGAIGRSLSMLEVFSKVRRIAPHFQTVLISGETGTGKELVARALHEMSPFQSGPFVVANAAAIADTLFESELFGYVKGAFTGAAKDKQGLAEFAAGGTLFLDEISEMPVPSQAKLLRLVQNREVQRLGSPAVRKVDVRVVAATNRNLRAMVDQKLFREDLYYRLAMVEIKLPRLAERKEDLVLLEQHFLQGFAQRYGKPEFHLTRRAQALLARYNWPGNVRELENVLGYCSMMAEEQTLDVRDLPEHIQKQAVETDEQGDALLSLDELTRRHASMVLLATGGNRTRTAEILGVSRATLYRLLGRGGELADAVQREEDGELIRAER